MRASPPGAVTESPRAGRLASAALLLSISFVLSRVLGVIRNSAIAAVFGTRQVDAYFAAFRIPDTMFTLVSGGALASAFIPVFAGLLAGGREGEGWRLASDVFNAVAVALAVLAVAGFLLATPIMSFFTGNFTPAERSLTIDLTRIMLLQPIFLGTAAIISAVLQTYNRFLLTALAPLVYNVVIIIGALLGHTYGVVGLAWSVVLAAAAQVVIQLPGVSSDLAGRYSFGIERDAAPTREVLHLFLPRVAGLAAFQAMLFITLFLATRLPQGMLSAINFSWVLIYFPVGALGTAAATAIFPTLSRLTAAEDFAALRRTVNRSLRLVLFLALPSAVGMIVLRRPIVNLLYDHGVWTSQRTEQTAFALLFYALALAPLAAIEVLPRVYYAMRDTVTPVRIAVAAVALDAALSILFVNLLPPASGQGGLALATAIATTVQAGWLTVALDRRLGGIGISSLLLALRDAAIASASMGVILYVLLVPLTAIFPQRGFGVLITVVVEVGIGLGVFGGVSYLLGAPELWQVRAFAGRGK